MVAPALQSIKADLQITDEVVSQLTLSIFVLAYAVGPLFLGPLSEIYGRVIVLQLANLFFLVFNIACGVCQTKEQMIVFRFLAGLGGSAPLAVSSSNGRNAFSTLVNLASRSVVVSFPTASDPRNVVKALQSTVLLPYLDRPWVQSRADSSLSIVPGGGYSTPPPSRMVSSNSQDCSSSARHMVQRSSIREPRKRARKPAMNRSKPKLNDKMKRSPKSYARP